EQRLGHALHELLRTGSVHRGWRARGRRGVRRVGGYRRSRSGDDEAYRENERSHRSMSLLCGLPGRIFLAGLTEEVLTDQVFEHDRVLHELDLRALVQERLGAPRRDTDVLAPQQAGREYA